MPLVSGTLADGAGSGVGVGVGGLIVCVDGAGGAGDLLACVGAVVVDVGGGLLAVVATGGGAAVFWFVGTAAGGAGVGAGVGAVVVPPFITVTTGTARPPGRANRAAMYLSAREGGQRRECSSLDNGHR